MKIQRHYSDLAPFIKENKVLVIFGPRQVGKTTLLKDFLASTQFRCLFETGDNIRTQEILGTPNLAVLRDFVNGFELLVIDEAQNIPSIGLSLKLLVDNIPGLRVIAAGSSSFDRAGQIGEPLTGRKTTLRLFPIALNELSMTANNFSLRERLPELLIYGTYPEVLTTSGSQDKRKLLDELVNGSLLKDIFTLERLRNPGMVLNLLRLLAFQIGNEVSLNELATQLHLDVKTIQRYIGLLEESFILIALTGFSKNLRKEVSQKKKYYFYDTGIRNAVISNFNPLNLRTDIGALWENFFIVERLKKRTSDGVFANQYFWRTWSKQELDLIEERDGTLFAYECKWKAAAVKAPREWTEHYPESTFEVVTPDNFLSLVL